MPFADLLCTVASCLGKLDTWPYSMRIIATQFRQNCYSGAIWRSLIRSPFREEIACSDRSFPAFLISHHQKSLQSDLNSRPANGDLHPYPIRMESSDGISCAKRDASSYAVSIRGSIVNHGRNTRHRDGAPPVQAQSPFLVFSWQRRGWHRRN